MWVVENMVLRGIFGPRRDEVTGEWRSLHNDVKILGPTISSWLLCSGGICLPLT